MIENLGSFRVRVILKSGREIEGYLDSEKDNFDDLLGDWLDNTNIYRMTKLRLSDSDKYKVAYIDVDCIAEVDVL